MADFPRGALSESQRALYDLLLDLGQEHLFSEWSAADDERRRDAFFEQIQRLHTNYPGGLRQYVANARRELAASQQDVNPFQDCVPHVARGVKLDVPGDDFLACERIGMEHIADAAFVLVAGGLGERLGFSSIKIALPIETTTRKSFLQYYIEYILAFQTRARRQRGDAGLRLPLMIMTSGDTYEPTRRFLEQHHNFGMDADQVILLLQEKVPSLADHEARFVSAASDPYQIETKPHGHGDVHALLHASGLTERWRQEGRRWVFFFQDTNGLAFRGFAAALGASVRENFDVNMIAVPRTAGEAIGAISRLEYADGRSKTLSVEYNQLDALLRSTVSEQGDVPDESGWSPYPGNVNILVFSLGSYCETLARNRGSIPEFVNPKYADDSRTVFKKPTRLECLMQDYVKLDLGSAVVGVTQIDRWLIFSPVKNALPDAWALHYRGIPMESAASGEMDIYRATCRLLATAPQNEIADVGDRQPGCTPLPVGPRLVVAPACAVTVGELVSKFRRLKVQRDATLVVEGEHVEIDGLELDGTLIVRVAEGARLHLRGLRISNDGWPIRQLQGDGRDEEIDAIRGYIIHRDETAATVIESRGDSQSED
jgi:UDP-sugar pyrophosphorylase